MAGLGATAPMKTVEATRARGRSVRPRRLAENAMWYVVLVLISIVTVFPFAWIVLTSIKGPADLLFSTPPQFLPAHPTLDNYGRVLASLPIPTFFQNSIVASVTTTVLNVIVASLAAYPLAKMKFRGREVIFYLLIATLIVPTQLTFIPGYLMARFFGYYDSLPAIILPSLAERVQHLPHAPGIPWRAERAHRCRAGRRRPRVADLVADHGPARPAHHRDRRDLHVRHVVERLLLAVADAPDHREQDAARRSGRAAGLLQLRLPGDRGGRGDDGRPDPHLLHRAPAPLRARPGRRGEGLMAIGAIPVPADEPVPHSPADAIERLMGERILRTFVGLTPTPDVLAAIRAGRASGVSLYRAKNVESPAQMRDLTAALQAARPAGAPPLIVALDQEGGQLQAIGDGATAWPGNLALAATGSTDLARRTGAAIGAELAAMGINVDLAPVCDLLSDPRSPLMGTRTFGDEPALAGRLAAAMVQGIQSAGVAATLKHFPGHGSVAGDSHHGLPVSSVDAATLRSRELVPFRAGIEAGARLVMLGHLAVPALTDGHVTPATLAPELARALLRDELGFEGVSVTDALDMGALYSAAGPGAFAAELPAIAVGAARAGLDLLLTAPRPRGRGRGPRCAHRRGTDRAAGRPSRFASPPAVSGHSAHGLTETPRRGWRSSVAPTTSPLPARSPSGRSRSSAIATACFRCGRTPSTAWSSSRHDRST